MDSPTQWTWVWVNSGGWWWTGRPDVLCPMGSQTDGHNWATELNWKTQIVAFGIPAHNERIIVFGRLFACSKGNTIHTYIYQFSSVQFSRSVVSDSLRPHESQHARPPYPLPSPRVHSNSCPSSRWCHPAISSSVIPFSSCPQSLPAWVFSNESPLHMMWPKYWSFSFSISPSKEHPD